MISLMQKKVFNLFGQKLRKLREKTGLTQEQFAKKFNVLKSSISMYENGVRLPNAELIKEFANFFGVSIDYLLDNDTSNTIDNQLKENEAIRKTLQRAGFMENNDDLSDEEIEKIIDFLVINKKFFCHKD